MSLVHGSQLTHPGDACGARLQQGQGVLAEEASLYQAFHRVAETLHST